MSTNGVGNVNGSNSFSIFALVNDIETPASPMDTNTSTGMGVNGNNSNNANGVTTHQPMQLPGSAPTTPVKTNSVAMKQLENGNSRKRKERDLTPTLERTLAELVVDKYRTPERTKRQRLVPPNRPMKPAVEPFNYGPAAHPHFELPATSNPGTPNREESMNRGQELGSPPRVPRSLTALYATMNLPDSPPSSPRSSDSSSSNSNNSSSNSNA